MQGRSAFGGLTAALAIRALRHEVDGDRTLRSVDAAFIGPLGPGAVDISTELLRSGRSATHASAELHSGGALAARVHTVFGTARKTSITRPFPQPEPTQVFEDTTPWPYIPGVMPAFCQHLEYRPTEGDAPFSGSKRATLGGWAVLEPGTSGPITPELIVALTDAWPGPMLPLGTRPFPASTMRMSVQLVGTVPRQFDGRWWFRSECTAAADGYATVVGSLYAGQHPVAWMEQLVAYFDAPT